MNIRHFHEIIGSGNYGRKIAYANVDVITEDNIVGIIGKTIGIFNSNKTAIDYLWNYYKGDQPVLYRSKVVRSDVNNKVVENHAFEYVRFKTQQTYGEPFQYVSDNKDEQTGRYVEKFIKYMEKSHNQARNVELGKWQSATGTAFKAMQKKDGEIPFRLVVVSPMTCYIVYSESTKEPLLAVQQLKDEDNKVYYLCFSETHECKIQNGKVIPGSFRLHGYGAIPIVEYPNNSERLSDIEIIITMLDAVNSMQSARMDGIDQFIQSFMKFINCEIDEKTFSQMKAMGAFMIKSNNGDNKADVDIMSQELNQTQTQVAKEDLIDNMEGILAIPSKNSGSDGGSTQGAVELRSGWDFSKGAAKLKDPCVIEAETRMCVPILKRIALTNGDCPLKLMDFDIRIHHSPLDNMLVKAQFLDYLLKDGVNPMLAFERSTLFPDSEKAYQLSKPYLDVLYKTIDDVKAEMVGVNDEVGRTE